MDLLAGILTGARLGSAAAVTRSVWSRGACLQKVLGAAGALVGGVALLLLLFAAPWSELQDELVVWCVAGAAGVLGLATVAGVLERALDLEAS